MKHEFISNTNLNNKENLYKYLKVCFENSISFKFSVAFINFAGVQIILDILKNTERKNIKGEILTTNYLHFTELKSIEFLRKFKNIEIKFYDSDEMDGFHTKGYIFEYDNYYKAIIGSSNLTKSGLKQNIEWNTSVTASKDSDFIDDILSEFDYLWEKGVYNVKEYTTSQIKKYTIKKIENNQYLEVAEDDVFGIYKNVIEIEPNYMQEVALKNIETLRAYKENRALCISATGTGKTYLGAFDVKNFNAKRLLFIVHNETILKSAIKTFEKVIKDKSMGLFTGNKKERDKDYLFSTIQTLNNNYSEFKEDEFDYIIIDEAHHATASSYEKIINYFKPKFLLGLTATPERCDSGNIYEVFDMNVPIEIRLQEALDKNLITPFHYYGVKDIEEIDLKDVDITNIFEITKRLSVRKRVDFVVEQMNFYGFSGNKRKTIGFCVSVEHAQYMAKEFNDRGIKSASLTGNDNKDVREEIIRKFEETEELEIIFVVDIFNEGVDIPCINSILMLRPTASPIIFTQQLGRGLRHYREKEFLTVIDFIGNHTRSFLIAIALMGKKGYDKESLKIAVKRDFDNLSKTIHINMDEICKNEILEQLDNENFNSLKYLKSEFEEFKLLLKGKIPTPLDFIQHEGAPQFYKYSKLQKSYIDFLEKIKNEIFEIDEELKIVIREFERFLPIKRVYEFAIIHELISKKEVLDESEIFKLVAKHIDIDSINHTKETIRHAMKFLSGYYSDSQELARCEKLFEISDRKIFKTEYFKNILENKNVKNYILEILDYGILKYKENFGEKDYGFPFLKLYENYTMKDVALLCNYDKKHSAFRGQGLLKKDNDYFLFIELHKEVSIKESINYKDKIIDRYSLQWETPNSTKQDSEIGLNIINNIARDIKLHIFVRKYKQIDTSVQPYIYIGTGDCVSYEGNKPITTTLKLKHILEKNIFIELTEKVEKYLEVADVISQNEENIKI